MGSWFDQARIVERMLPSDDALGLRRVMGTMGCVGLDIEKSYVVCLNLADAARTAVDVGDGLLLSRPEKHSFMLSLPVGFVQYFFDEPTDVLQSWLDHEVVEAVFDLAGASTRRLEEIAFDGVSDPILRDIMMTEARDRDGAAFDDQMVRRDTASALGLASRLLYCVDRDAHSRMRTVGLSLRDLRRLEEFAIANLDAGLGTDALARTAGIGEAELTEGFRNIVGKSPMGWVRDIRATRARHLAQRTTKPLAEIAAECGYSSQSHMGADFRSRFGATPRQVRKGDESSDDRAGAD